MPRKWTIIIVALFVLGGPALAGPPYVSGDPEPTDYKHFEIYSFSNGTATRDGIGGASGIDFNYGAAPDLHLTATLPVGFDRPTAGQTSFGLSNIELAAKYRFLRQDSFGLDERFECGRQQLRLAASAGVGSEGLGRRMVRLWWGRACDQQPLAA